MGGWTLRVRGEVESEGGDRGGAHKTDGIQENWVKQWRSLSFLKYRH